MKIFDRIKIMLDLLIEFCYLTAVFFVPLYFAVFWTNSDIFEISKIVLFKMLALLLTFFTFIKLILFYQFFGLIKVFNKNFIIIILFLLSLILSTYFSINQSLSFFGDYSRFQGLESYFYYLLFFCLIIINLSLLPKNIKNKKIDIIIFTALISSFLVSLYGIAQWFGYDFFNWTEPALLTKRTTSTLGQPNYLASYLILVIPLSLYFYFKNNKFLNRFVILVLLFFQIVCLFFTGSRGGILGLFFGFLVLFLIFLIKNYKSQKLIISTKKIFYAIILVVFIFSFGIFVFKDSKIIKRFSDLTQINAGSVAPRISFWKASLDAIPKKLFFGYGLDSQGEVFSGCYQKDWAINGDVNVYPNRAHNLFFDILLTSGLAGLISYLLVLFLFFKIAYRNINSSVLKSASFFIAGAGAGYLFSLLFNFAVVTTEVYFWLFFAIIWALSNDKEILERTEKNKFIILKLILILFLSFFIFDQINIQLKYLNTDSYFRELKQAYSENDYFTTLEFYSYIREENLPYDYYKQDAGLMISDLVINQPLDFYKEIGRKELRIILEKIKSNNYSDVIAKAKINFALGNNAEAEAYFLKATELSSEMPKNYRELAHFYYLTGDVEKAEKYYKQALSFLPDFNSPYINSRRLNKAKQERYLIYKDLADFYFSNENYISAEKYYKLAFDDNLNDLALLKKIADTYYKRGDLNTAIWYNKHGMIRSPKDYVWPYAIALLYQEKGNKEEARIFIDKAFILSPDNNQIEELMQKLNR